MSIIERGFAHVIKNLGGNKRSWESQPPWVSDGSKYVPSIYSRDESKKCYRVQVGLVGAVIYDTGVVEIYDPELKEIRVKSEEWEIWSVDKKATLNTPITWSVVENNSGVYITREQTTSKPDGLLRIVYGFIVGAQLKHTVTWVSTEVATVTVQVKQVHLMDFDKVTTDTGTSIASQTLQQNGYTLHLIRSAEVLSEKSANYKFSYGMKDFWLFENQYAMVYDSTGALLTGKCLQTGEIDFAGKKVTYTFGDWTLATGEALEIDPSPATLNDPTEDGYTKDGTSRDKTGADIEAGKTSGVLRAYVQWPTTSIPDAATITDTVFKYSGAYHGKDCHIHAIAAKPSTASDATLHADIADGTVYADPDGFPVQGTNKQIDLGATADSDLQGLLASDWFAIGIQADDEVNSGYSAIFSEEGFLLYNFPPPPTLYVEYTVGGPTPGWNKLQYLTEPPTAGAFNKLKFASEPPVPGSWNKILYSTE